MFSSYISFTRVTQISSAVATKGAELIAADTFSFPTPFKFTSTVAEEASTHHKSSWLTQFNAITPAIGPLLLWNNHIANLKWSYMIVAEFQQSFQLNAIVTNQLQMS